MDPSPFRPRRQALSAGDLTALRADRGLEPKSDLDRRGDALN
jgi:hypothetical protein